MRLKSSRQPRLLGVTVETMPELRLGSPQVLIDGDFFTNAEAGNYDVSLDGRRFLTIGAVDAESEDIAPPQINIVLNWFEQLKEQVPVP